MAKTKTNTLSIKEIRRAIGFNKNLTSVNYEKDTGYISFHFLNNGFFEMYEHGWDYGAFDEFAYHCIDGFDPENLSDDEIIERSKQVYHSVVKLFQTQAIAKFLTDSHRQIGKKIMEVKTDSRLFMPRFAELQRTYFQPETF